jgi:hypothetical protein
VELRDVSASLQARISQSVTLKGERQKVRLPPETPVWTLIPHVDFAFIY